jgi:hypothetical protein
MTTVCLPAARKWSLLTHPLVFILVMLAACNALAAQVRPTNVYLTYSGDPSETIVVNFNLTQQERLSERDVPQPVVYYDTQSRGGDKGAYAHSATGTRKIWREQPMYQAHNAVPITGLAPNTVYYFIAGNDAHGYTEERSFRTIPAGDEPLRFVTGGDTESTPLTEALMAQAARLDPLFAAIGGDIAYANDQLSFWGKWDAWFELYDKHMRTPAGHMIPMVAAIGNHETNDYETGDPAIKAFFYTTYFGNQQAGGKTYCAQRFGENMLLLVLDSGHVTPHGGEQSAWLAQTLARHRDVPVKFAMYHVPLYPSNPGAQDTMRTGQIHWEPYFSAFGLTAAFENHDHRLKRTKPMRNGEAHEDGVLYIGDGCFGVSPRDVDRSAEPDYMEFQASEGHFWLVEVSPEGVHYRAIGAQGQVLDEAASPARAALEAVAK